MRTTVGRHVHRKIPICRKEVAKEVISDAPRFSQVAPTPKGTPSYYLINFFSEKCIKMKKYWLGEGGLSISFLISERPTYSAYAVHVMCCPGGGGTPCPGPDWGNRGGEGVPVLTPGWGTLLPMGRGPEIRDWGTTSPWKWPGTRSWRRDLGPEIGVPPLPRKNLGPQARQTERQTPVNWPWKVYDTCGSRGHGFSLEPTWICVVWALVGLFVQCQIRFQILNAQAWKNNGQFRNRFNV